MQRAEGTRCRVKVAAGAVAEAASGEAFEGGEPVADLDGRRALGRVDRGEHRGEPGSDAIEQRVAPRGHLRRGFALEDPEDERPLGGFEAEDVVHPAAFEAADALDRDVREPLADQRCRVEALGGIGHAGRLLDAPNYASDVAPSTDAADAASARRR